MHMYVCVCMCICVSVCEYVASYFDVVTANIAVTVPF